MPNLFDEQPGDIVLRCEDHPLAVGVPLLGHGWRAVFKLEGGKRLLLDMGPESRAAFRKFILNEEVDDAIDAASQELT